MGGYSTLSDENLRLVERFRRVADDTIEYTFTVDNPTMWTKPWTAVINWKRSRGELHDTPVTRATTACAGCVGRAGGGSRQAITPMVLSPGTRVGPYEVMGTLGAGGMGEVYRARDAKLGRDVALKLLPPAFASDPERLDISTARRRCWPA